MLPRGGTIIKCAREAREMTQEDVSIAHGPCVKTIGRWESNSTPIPFDDVIWIITDVFKMTFDQALELATNENN